MHLWTWPSRGARRSKRAQCAIPKLDPGLDAVARSTQRAFVLLRRVRDQVIEQFPSHWTMTVTIELDVPLFSAAIGSGAVNEHVTATARRAFERGAFGVPTFFVEDRMFWGNDRLVLLEHYLAQEDRR